MNVSAQEVDTPNDDDDVEAEEETEEEVEKETEEEIEEEKEEVEDETEEQVKDIESDIESAIDEDLEAIEDDSFSQDSVRNALNDGDDQSEDLVAEPLANEEPKSVDLDQSLSAAFENFDPLAIDEATGSFVYDPDDDFVRSGGIENSVIDPVRPQTSTPGGVGASPDEIAELIAALIQDTGTITEDTTAAIGAAGVVADGQSELILDSLTKQVGVSPGGLQGTNPGGVNEDLRTVAAAWLTV